MEIETVEKNTVKDKYSNLLSKPAAFFKKYSFNSRIAATEQELAADELLDQEADNSKSISLNLIELIRSTQQNLENNGAFDSILELAESVTNISEANHVLLAFTDLINSLCKDNVFAKKSILFALPGSILDKFFFPEDYKDQSDKLKSQCGKIQNIIDLKTSFQNVFELISSIYKESIAQKKELESFLYNVGIQISRIGDELHSAVEIQTADIKIQNDLNTRMNDAVNDISKNVLSANDLNVLKNTVKSQLDSLQYLVEEERQVVQAHESRVKESVHVLAKKVDKLKIEAQQLRERVQEEKENALRDPLTGLFNREAYDNKINNFITECKQTHTVVSLLIWDVDHFKKFNDTYGHVIGDKVLKAVSKKLNQSLESDYFLARYGGEEFVMLLPGVTDLEAIRYADKVREEITNVTFMIKAKPIKITISCGIALIDSNDNVESVFERADKALYEAKKNGRNCVKISNDLPST